MDIDNAERAADLEKRLKNRSSNEKIPDEAEKNSGRSLFGQPKNMYCQRRYYPSEINIYP